MIQTDSSIKLISPDFVGANPFKVICEDSELPYSEWLSKNKEIIQKKMIEYGAVLLRGFDINSVDEFHNAYKVICGDPIEYTFRTSPREEVSEKIYTSTSHPADQVIHMHTENSYSVEWNRFIGFYCLVPPSVRGETPIAHEGRVIEKISKKALDKFREKGVMYVRNTQPGIGLDWRTIYQTSDKSEVERFLASKNMEFEWVSEDHLRTKWVLPAFRQHPVTKEDVWFNHMYFGHKTLYDPMVLDFIGEDNLPFATYYGDGTVIEDEVISELNNAYEECKIEFPWQKGDLLLMDNMMFSHGRNPFEGERTILVAMSQVVR